MKAYKRYPSAQQQIGRAYANPNSKLNRANRRNARSFRKAKFVFFILWTIFFGSLFAAGHYFPEWYASGGLACLAQFIGMIGGVFGLMKVLEALVPERGKKRWQS